MKTEILNDIKKTEAEYQSMISTAQEEKRRDMPRPSWKLII